MAGSSASISSVLRLSETLSKLSQLKIFLPLSLPRRNIFSRDFTSSKFSFIKSNILISLALRKVLSTVKIPLALAILSLSITAFDP